MTTIRFRFLAVALTAVIAAGLFPSCNREKPEHLFFSEVKTVDKLVLARMSISKMATVDDLRLDEARGLRQTVEALGDAVKIGSRKAAYSYDTYMRAYIDMSAFTEDDVEVDEAARTVTLHLPPVVTELEGRDAQVREDHYRVTGLRSAVDAPERAEIKEKMNAALRREVDSNPMFRRQLVERAQEKARAYFTSLLASDGYDVRVEFDR